MRRAHVVEREVSLLGGEVQPADAAIPVVGLQDRLGTGRRARDLELRLDPRIRRCLGATRLHVEVELVVVPEIAVTIHKAADKQFIVAEHDARKAA